MEHGKKDLLLRMIRKMNKIQLIFHTACQIYNLELGEILVEIILYHNLYYSLNFCSDWSLLQAPEDPSDLLYSVSASGESPPGIR